MIRFEDLLERVRGYTSDEEREFLRRAYVFSALEHKGQVRHSGEPYLVHPLEVASILADMRLDPVAIAAGLLHDVVEDTLTTIEKIEEHFGPEVAHVVEGVTKIGAIPFSSSEERQAENFRKMLLAMVDDIRVILVKLADRLHNMRTLSHMSEDRQVRTAQETLDIYAPIANRLGMSKIKNELEELSFKYLDPVGYQSLTAKVESRRKAAEVEIEYLKNTITAKLSEAQVPLKRVDGRLKRLYSINTKLKRQRIELDQVYDFVALRVITDSVKDCYAALGIIHQTWSPVPGRIKDFIAMPRPNGYQSLHTSVISERGVPFEVQIRTEEMHRHAEEGIAAHWKYKEGRIGDHRDERHFQWLRQLLEVQSEVRDPHEFIQNLKVDLYPEEVYIFTPKGQVKAFPRGATPIDFAYAIHTDIGHQCVGARVNGKMVPLRTRLRNGDIVEIVTNAGHKPSRDWLNFVVTARARNKIKHFVQSEERTRSVELGKRLLEKEAAAGTTRAGGFVSYDINPARVEPHLVAISQPRSAYCEQFRSLRTRILQASERMQMRAMVVTSAGIGEGKTLTALNLGWLLAQTEGVRALVIDSDLRRPCATDYFGIDASLGLSEVLGGEAELEDAIVRLDPAGLYLLPGGRPRDDVAELLSGPSYTRVLTEARRMFDYIVIDAPPLGIFTDANVLMSRADGALLVVRAGHTRYSVVDKLLEQIPRERLLGVVLNRADEQPEATNYYSQYRYSNREIGMNGRNGKTLPENHREEEVAVLN